MIGAPPAEVDAYTFNGDAGDIIIVRMRFTSNSQDPQIELYKPSDVLVSSKSAANATVRLDTITLDETGQYTILAMERDGDEIGPYGISLQQTANPTDARPISYNQSLNDSIDIISEMDAYTFSGETGDMIIIRMCFGDARTGANSRLELYNPSGVLVSSKSTTYATVRLDTIKLGKSGQYTILHRTGSW